MILDGRTLGADLCMDRCQLQGLHDESEFPRHFLAHGYNSLLQVSGAAIVSAAFSVANIIGPQTFQAKDAPRYVIRETFGKLYLT